MYKDTNKLYTYFQLLGFYPQWNVYSSDSIIGIYFHWLVASASPMPGVVYKLWRVI